MFIKKGARRSRAHLTRYINPIETHYFVSSLSSAVFINVNTGQCFPQKKLKSQMCVVFVYELFVKEAPEDL